MKTMKTMKITFFTLIFFILAACAVPGADSTPIEPSDSQTPPASEEPGYSIGWLESLAPETILLQLDYEPTFFREEAFYPFGRIPPFTLFADGTLVYMKDEGTLESMMLMTLHLDQEAVLAIVNEVMDAGFEDLQDHLDFCFTDENGESVCIADDAYTILRATLAGGEFREVKTYSNFSNEPAAFEEILLVMQGYSHPDAVEYMPETAGLFIRRLPLGVDIPVGDWPLGPEKLPVPSDKLSVMVLTGEDLKSFIGGVGRNTGEFYFATEKGETFSAYLIPWLPYTDYASEALNAFPPATPAPVKEPFLSIQNTAVENLAGALGIDKDEIVVSSFEEVVWPNGCLGINYLEIACTEALVDGYRLILEAGGESYEYRANKDGSVVLPAMPTDSPPVESPDA